MAYDHETRSRLRALYIEGMPLNGAATTAGVSYETARDWKRRAKAAGDDWDTARAAYRVSEQGIDDLNRTMVEDFTRQVITTMRELNETNLSAADKASLLAQVADANSKFAKAFARINPAYSGLAVALDTLRTCADHLRTADPAALRALQPHLEDIGAVLGQRYG